MRLSNSHRSTDWWPPSWEGLFEPGTVLRTRFSAAERRVLRKRRAIPVSEWAARHRVLQLTSRPGQWRNETTPYLAGVMDASFFPSVREIVCCKGPQMGFSEAVHNCIGYAADRQPGPVLYVFPDQETARENAKDRIVPMFRTSPRLRSYLTGDSDDTSARRVNLAHMPIYLAWASSAARLANKPIKYLSLDEVDKYPALVGAEADPISLAEKRTTTFRHSRKIWKFSTPTMEGGAVWVAFNRVQAKFDYWARCPDCGRYQRMVWKQIQWPESETDPEKMRGERLAYYVCEQCGSCWDDAARDKAVKLGEWRARENGAELFAYLRERRPEAIAFHAPSWLSTFVSLSDAVATFLEGKTDKGKLRDWCNAHLAEPWKAYEQERTEDRILALRDDRPAGLVPPDTCLLTAGVDTQDNGFWYEVRAWGYGMERTSHQVRYGFVDTVEGVLQILLRDVYRDGAGTAYPVQCAVWDAMGHRASEVYDICRMHRGLLHPFKGEQRMATTIAWSNREVYPGTNKQIPGGVRLLRGNVTFFKDMLAGKLEINPADPGAWVLHDGCDASWARMLCAEYRDENGFWQCPEHKPNHGWDCSVYNLVATEIMGLIYIPKPGEKRQAPARQGHGNVLGSRRPGSGWNRR